MAVAGDIQREHRKRVRILAEMRVESKRIDVVICNVSSRGLMLTAEQAPPRGSYIEVSRAGVVTVARVVWTNKGRFGVHTRDKLNVAAMMHSPTEKRCMSIEASVPDVVPKVRTMGTTTQVQSLQAVAHQAQRNAWAGARMQFMAIGASVLLFAALGAFVTYELLSGMTLAVSAKLN